MLSSSSSSVAGSSNSNPRFNLMEDQEMVITSTTSVVNGDLKKKKNDRKIRTAQGLRDRRVRLSIGIARKFFDLQDTLGFDKASQTLDWLFTKSKLATSSSQDDDEDAATAAAAATSISLTNNGSGIQQETEQAKNNLRKESREKARERARSRTRAKQDQQLLLHYMSTAPTWDNITSSTLDDANHNHYYAADGRAQFVYGQTQMGE